MSYTAVTGNISEPKLGYTQGGKAMLKFSLAENHRRFDKQANEYQDVGTTWRQVTLWEEQAEIASELLQKGQRVIVVGQERTRDFTRDDGTPGSVMEIQADNIGTVIPKRRPQDSPPQQNAGGFGNASDPWAGQPQQAASGEWGGWQ